MGFRLFEDLRDFENRHKTSEMLIWGSSDFVNVIVRFVSKNYPEYLEIQLSTPLVEGVKESITIFGFESWPNVIFTNRAAVPCAGGSYILSVRSYVLMELCTLRLHYKFKRTQLSACNQLAY